MYSEKPLLHERQSHHVPGNLRTVAVDVTSRCNMSCDHCYAETFNKVAELDLETWHKVADELYEMGVFHYVIQGGEPTVTRDRLAALVSMIRPDETYINVVSNGWTMTPEMAHWLRQIKVDKVTFSMDSGIPEEHDQNRLPGSFVRVVAAVDLVLTEGLFSSVSTVVTHSNLHGEGFQKVLEFAKSRGIRVDIQIAEPVGKWDGIKEDLITPEDADYIKHLRDTMGQADNGQPMINRDTYCGDNDHCPAGTEFMSISANGELLSCNFLQFSLGNVRDGSIAQKRRDLLTCSWFDNSHRTCICGEDDEFIDRFIVPFKEEAKPLDAYSVFDLPNAWPGRSAQHG
jgi:MoaA/NifB/PqqE/SkfB family radical SAM enzyme